MLLFKSRELHALSDSVFFLELAVPHIIPYIFFLNINQNCYGNKPHYYENLPNCRRKSNTPPSSATAIRSLTKTL